MTVMTRRRLLTTAAGTAALGLGGQLAFLPPAFAADLRAKGHYSYKVGDIEVISIYDGIWERSADETFIVGKSPDDVKAALRGSGYSDAFIPIEFAFTVVKTGGKTIMIDAGTGAQLAPTAGLAANGGLANAGIAPEDIDTILISHMHPDHIFGLMEKETNAQVFPNAEIKVGESEYGFWTDPATLAALPENRRGLAERINATFPTWGNVSQFGDDKEIAPGITAVPSAGHTPGHTTFHVASGNDELLLIGDAILLPALFLSHLDWSPIFDADAAQAIASRKALVDRAVADGSLMGGYHFGFPNAGKIVADGGSFTFEPASA